MDVNGTRFHYLAGNDWRHLVAEPTGKNLHWDDVGQSVRLQPRAFRFPLRPDAPTLSMADRRGASADRFGTRFWISADRRAVEISAGKSAGTFWHVADFHRACVDSSAGERLFRPVTPQPPGRQFTLRGLTVTRDHYLVVGTLEPPGLLLFDLHRGGDPHWLRWPSGSSFAPLDLDAAPDGGAWVLDGTDPPRLWKLDQFFRVISFSETYAQPAPPRDFRPQSPATAPPTPCPRAPISDETALVPGVGHLHAISVLPDDSVLLLQNDPDLLYSKIHRYVVPQIRETISLEAVLEEKLDDVPPVQYHIRVHDMVFVPGPDAPRGAWRGTLMVAATNGIESFAITLASEFDRFVWRLGDEHYPMRRFTGKGLIADRGEAYYDHGQNWIPLTPHRRPRYASRGELSTLVFDSALPDCHWHRVIVDACIPEGCRLRLESRSAGSLPELAAAVWHPEPPPVLRPSGSEQPWHEPFRDKPDERAGSWDTLLQDARGRYLELRLRFFGNGKKTPSVRGLRVHYPRFSYLNEYLPAVYRDDPSSASFLDRFLANVEGLYTALEGKIEHAQRLLDPGSTPGELLPWLAGWLGTELDAVWDEARKRLFLSHAVELFQWRGTISGLTALIQLAIDECPDANIFRRLTGPPCHRAPLHRSVRIVEHFLKRRYSDDVLGDPSARHVVFETTGGGWRVELGAAALHERYRRYLCRRYCGPRCDQPTAAENLAALQRLNSAWSRPADSEIASFGAIELHPLTPTAQGESEDQQRFFESQRIAYGPVSDNDRNAYQQFLRRRYGVIDRVNEVYGLPRTQMWASFDAITLPNRLPDGGRPLADWMEFVAFALPVRRNAHRFTVLVPTQLNESQARRDAKLRIVEGVVRREKPAHTEFDVKLFWAHFQVGGARIGIDTVVGEGSRYSALVLGRDFLGRSMLETSHPWDAPHRFVLPAALVSGETA